MLRQLRKKKVAKRIFYVLAVLIIPAFVIWGSASVINKKDRVPNIAGRIFGKNVSYDRFQQSMQAWKTHILLQYGEEAEKNLRPLLNPINGAWDRLIMLHEVRRRGIRISDRDVVDHITRLPFLQKNGRFDPQSYELFLKYTLRMDARQFEEQARQDISMTKVYEEVTKPVTITDDEARAEYKKQHTETRLRYVLFSPQSYKNNIAVTDEELNKYYETSKETFKVPPQINAVFCMIPYDEKTTEEEKGKAQETMQKIARKAKTAGLKAAAQEAGLEAKETGFFGFNDPIPALGWLPQIKTAIFDTPQGAITQPLETERGIYLFGILEKKDAYIPDFKEAKDKVRTALIEEKASQIAFQNAQDFLNRVRNPEAKEQPRGPEKTEKTPVRPAMPFDRAAENLRLDVKETPPFTKDSYIPELGLATVLKDAAFGLKKDEIYDKPVSTPQGFLVIQSLQTPSLDEDKLKKEFDDFKKSLLEQKRNEAFNSFFEDLKKQAHLVSYVNQIGRYGMPVAAAEGK
ncbi:peptidyl-prolyl cis-trans isomerase [Candidatus Velamenicoccus archaeovorus]|uniref:Periplasmic chaperone PpiD n=1 Tax=Velamenicoccus archaeovorus TaxID=1930593 RepID=A0A410P2A9_VELA1|nr:peptidylprolyl isomerase [Candidatus Velamenicoccus archaeovorus]QAT16337.1 peptidyl-prolyl cis-trans isomerase [Candidatus Velamenicoccus archaeovorus]